MKTKFLIPFLCMAAVVACNEKQIDPVIPGEGECTLRVSVGYPQTKVANQTLTAEKTIRNVQVFVFRAGGAGDDGVLEIAASKGFDSELNVTDGQYSDIVVKTSTGIREVWAVVNDSKDRTAGADAVRTKTEFLAQTHALETSRPDKLFMIGHSNPQGATPAMTFTEGTVQVSIPVHRLAASVVLEGIVNDFSSPAYQVDNIFRLESAYLLNVPGRRNFGETLEPSIIPTEDWYARLAAETGGARGALLYDTLSGELLNFGQTHTTKHTFYSYPNDCAASENADFSPRASVLVVEASINYGSAGTPNWIKYYYPVFINNGLASNKQYHVTLTIHRPGALDPIHPVTFADATPLITVTDWETGDSYTPEI